MKDWLFFIILLPRGIAISGPFAIAGTLIGFGVGVVVGMLLGKLLW
jgi:hypothetical protein